MTAADQQALGVVDIVVPEPGEGAHADPAETARRLKADRPRPAGRARRARPSTSSSTAATAATGPSGPTLRRDAGDRSRRPVADSAIACATCSIRVGVPSAPPSRPGRATSRRPARRSSECPNRSSRKPAAPDRTAAERAADHAAIDRLSGELLPALIAKLGGDRLGELEVREGAWRVRLRRPADGARRRARRATADRASASVPHAAGARPPRPTARRG